METENGGWEMEIPMQKQVYVGGGPTVTRDKPPLTQLVQC